jgi:SAM-dependent methyltransferase
MHWKMTSLAQDKHKEIAFFDNHAKLNSYDVFTADSNARLINRFKMLTGLSVGSRIADLGCGSGVFTELLRQSGYEVVGIDISPKLIAVGKEIYPNLDLREGDVENLPFAAGSLDGVLLAGLVHHFPDPTRCAEEVFRVLRTGGRFMAFDPNRMNPFMFLYRDRSSPFYSSVGVTENERPIIAGEVGKIFSNAGFRIGTEYISGLSYRYVASKRAFRLLPIYNAIDRNIFGLPFMRVLRPFVLTHGEKN